MKAAARHDIGLAAQNVGGDVLDLEELKQAERSLGVLKEEIDVRFRAGLIASCGAEQVKLLHAKPLSRLDVPSIGGWLRHGA
jgi:hypothetical protein